MILKAHKNFQPTATKEKNGTALVLHPVLSRISARSPQVSLREAERLAEAIDLAVGTAECISVPRPRAATLFGKGTLETLKNLKDVHEADVIIINGPLTPVQQRNLERSLQAKVLDRTGLVLEIFARRARSHEGKLQVDLAYLTYQKSRLVRSWTHLERQRGAVGFIGGPGERQIEIDRRLIEGRIRILRKRLEKVRRRRGVQRASRRREAVPVVALVGYTNAGKTTLFNHLSHADKPAQDALFATLDPSLRAVRVGKTKTVFSDTVGFISDLPTHLVNAFHATLEEVLEAALILHVRDASSGEVAAQKDDVEGVLKALGVCFEKTPIIEVFNKIDLLPQRSREILTSRADVTAISALTGEGTEALLAKIERLLPGSLRRLRFSLGPQDGPALAWLYNHARASLKGEREGRIHLEALFDDQSYGAFRKTFPHIRAVGAESSYER